jgi:hypothetical protein
LPRAGILQFGQEDPPEARDAHRPASTMEGDTVELQRDAARLGTIATVFIWVGWLAVLYSFIAGILWWIDLAQRPAFNFLEAFAISAAAIGVPLFLSLIVAAAGHALRLFASYASGKDQ